MRVIFFFVILIAIIFVFASIKGGLKEGASLTLKVILGWLAFFAVIIFLLVTGSVFD